MIMRTMSQLAQCEPCALLSNPVNRGKKHGKTVIEQIGLLEFEKPVDFENSHSISTQRGMHKRWQVESFFLVLRRLIAADPLRPWNIVDFGSGTGSLLLPLACLFPSCKFTGVDMKPAALAILRQRAAAAGLSNVHTFLGMIEQFHAGFDVALALHACGNATDVAMLKAQQHRAAYLVSPCCVGKLKFSMAGGTSFGPTAAGWRWMPRLRGAEAELQLAGQWLQAAAWGDDLPRSAGSAVAPVLAAEAAAGMQAGGEHGVAGGSVAGVAENGEAAAVCSEGGAVQQRPSEPRGPPSNAPHPPASELQHPRSRALQRLLPDPQRNFKILAQVADTNLGLEERQAARDEPNAHARILATVWRKLEDEEAGYAQQQQQQQQQQEQQQQEQQQEQQQQQQEQQQQQREGQFDGHQSLEMQEEQQMAPSRAHPRLRDLGSPSTRGTLPEERTAGECFETEAARDAAYCALAKLHIEIDRNEQAREAGYAVGIFRMLHAHSMAKGDLLVGFPAEAGVWCGLLPLLRPDAAVCLAPGERNQCPQADLE